MLRESEIGNGRSLFHHLFWTQRLVGFLIRSRFPLYPSIDIFPKQLLYCVGNMPMLG